MSKRTYRLLHSLLCLLTAFVLFASFYFEYIVGLEPCPLCMMQRVCVFFLFLFCLMALSLSTLKRAKLVASVQVFFALAGLYFSARQLWLQSLPPEKTPACMPGLDVLLSYFPWQDILHALFLGAGDCAEQAWSWLGLTMPAWAALYFLSMGVANACIIYVVHRQLKTQRF